MPVLSLALRRGCLIRRPGRWSPQLYSGVDHGTAASPEGDEHFQILSDCQGAKDLGRGALQFREHDSNAPSEGQNLVSLPDRRSRNVCLKR